MQKRKAIKFKSQKFSYIKKGSRMYILKVAFPLLKKYKTKKKFHGDVDLYLLKICAKSLGTVTRNIRTKDKKSQSMYKYTFIKFRYLPS